jgi:hypothetical protein
MLDFVRSAPVVRVTGKHDAGTKSERWPIDRRGSGSSRSGPSKETNRPDLIFRSRTKVPPESNY